MAARGRRDRARPQFADFAEGTAYVNGAAYLAEEVNHHPDVVVHGWNRVRLTVAAHSAGGPTDDDYAMAERIDGLR